MLRMVARREAARAHDPAQIALDERDAGALAWPRRCPCPWRCRRAAWASAGASLTPSPAMATTRPSACSRLTTRAFCSGRTSASTSSMPELARHRLGGGAAVAGEHDDAQALGRGAGASPRGWTALIGIGHAEQPGERGRRRRRTSRSARRARSSSARARERRRVDASALPADARLPSATRRPVDAPGHALAR